MELPIYKYLTNITETVDLELNFKTTKNYNNNTVKMLMLMLIRKHVLIKWPRKIYRQQKIQN